MRNLYFVLVVILFSGPVFAQPTFTLSSSMCQEKTASLTANNGTMMVTGYFWYSSPTASIQSPSTQTTTVDFPSPGTYTVFLDVTDGSTVVTVSNTINILTRPLVSIWAPPTICPPPTQIGIWMSGSGATNYTWTPGGSTGANYTIAPQPTSNTTFTLYGEDSYGCSDTAVQYVQVHPAPFISANGPTAVCSGAANCFSAAGSVNIYYWTGPCGFSDNNQNPCFAINSGCGGTFTVGGTDMNGCLALTSLGISVSPCTSVDEQIETTEQLLFPNPVKDLLFLKEGVSAAEFADLQGRIISRKKINDMEDRRIDLSEFCSGTYFVKLICSDKTKVTRLIKD